MPAINTVLATVGYSKTQIKDLKRILEPAELIHCRGSKSQTLQAALDKADVAILGGDLDQRHLDAPNLKWIHCDHAGLERSARREVFEKDLVVTSSAGRSAPALAEHALFFMLSLAYRAPDLYEAQERHRWGFEGQNLLRAIHGSTLGILGMGHTGTELARRGQAMGMRVLAFRKRDVPAPKYVDRQYCSARGESPEMVLAESDYVVMAMRLSDATAGIIGEQELRAMKPTAFLINVARGALVNENALVQALYGGSIAGAGLDTFAVEPLPRTSRLWRAPNTLITPHFTPPLRDRTERSLEIIRENVSRYRSGRPMLNVLTEDDIYTRSSPRHPGRRLQLIRRVRQFVGGRAPD